MEGYWVTPAGKGISAITHITAIINDPKIFGETKESIQATYEKYGEKMGTEGAAREAIMIRAIGKGFIRVREYKNWWSIDVNRLNKRIANTLYNWAKTVRTRDPYADVQISELIRGKPVKMANTTFNELATGTFVVESKSEILLAKLRKLYEEEEEK